MDADADADDGDAVVVLRLSLLLLWLERGVWYASDDRADDTESRALL